jgi:hypothetical protein
LKANNYDSESLPIGTSSACPATSIHERAELNGPEIHYDAGTSGGRYWLQDNRGIWIPINEGSVRRHLKAAGLSSKTNPGDRISPIDEFLIQVQGGGEPRLPLRAHPRRIGSQFLARSVFFESPTAAPFPPPRLRTKIDSTASLVLIARSSGRDG